jgi:hypothetical protein
MYTDGFDELDGLRETDKGTRRTYVSNISQEEIDQLQSENERLRKALEKEQFFNKLLDQEIQELKAGQPNRDPQLSSYWYGNRGISRGAFYTLLFVALAMAGYIGYGIYYDKQFDYIKDFSKTGPTPAAVSDEAAPTFTTPTGNNQSSVSGEPQPAADEKVNNTVPQNTNNETTPARNETAPERATPAVKDSVPNIVARQQAQTRETRRTAEPERATTPPPTPAPKEIDVENQTTGTTGEVVDTRPVIARYRISSKANFYNGPDENTMRGVFISQGDDKIVGALEDRNGFIYVVYTNDLGYTSRGWLSKKDLTKIE